MNNNKNTTKNLLVLIQISILIIGLVAFTQMISAQISIAPLPTNVGRKTLIQSEEINQEPEENYRAPITGYSPFNGGGAAAEAVVAGGSGWIRNWLANPLPGLTEVGETVIGFLPRLKEIKIGKITANMKNLIGNVVVVAIVFAFTFAIISFSNRGDPDWNEALFWASRAALSASLGLTTTSLAMAIPAIASVPLIGWIIGGVVALYSFWRRTLRQDGRGVFFDCKPWQAQTGGQHCGECNNREFPCTLYQCRTLGQACELIDEGDYAKCVYNDRSTTAPTITARNDSLLSYKYKYNPIAATLGVEIQYSDDEGATWGCLPSYESFTYGIELDKLGACKMEYSTTRSFEEMTSSLPFGSGRFERNHTQLAFFPGQADLYEGEDGAELPAGEEQVYVRCESSNGYPNDAEFLFRFCIDPEDDNNEPIIQGFNLLERTPIKYFEEGEAHETDVTIYVQEPIEGCRWSHDDKTYEEMEENKMELCKSNIAEFTLFNAQISYTCSDTLTGLLNDQENNFYFRCNDSAGNLNTQSKELTLIGSRPLLIDSVGPEGTVIGASKSVKVTLEARTSAGLEDGKADCGYSDDTGDYKVYIRFTDTRSYIHSTDIYLEEEDYTYYIQCFDMAGNLEVATINFDVEADFGPPSVIRAYHSGGKLNLITSEAAKCVYDTVSCTYPFEEGISMSGSSYDITHSVAWSTEDTLYIKCQDVYENQPPSGCSIILRPFEFF